MKVIFVGSEKASSGVGIIPVFKGKKFYGTSKRYARDSVGQVKAAMKSAHFDGAKGTSVSLYAPTGSKLAGLLLKGAGEKANFDAEMFGATAMQELRVSGEKTLTLHLDGLKLKPDDAARAAVGARLAAYHFFKYRT